MILPTLSANPKTVDAIKALAITKIEQDYSISKGSGKEVVGKWIKCGITSPLMPSSFMQALIPFLYWHGDKRESMGRVRVPVDIAIGSSIGGFPEVITEPQQVAKRIEKYLTDSHSTSEARASGDYIPQLGVYIAHEGKHRVAFMRHHSEPYFLTNAHELHYPAANRIKMIRSGLAHNNLDYALLDGQYLQLLPPEPYSPVSLLEGYGVEWVGWADLNAPSETFVLKAITESGLLDNTPESTCESARTFDLSRLMTDELAHIQADKQNQSLVSKITKLLLGS